MGRKKSTKGQGKSTEGQRNPLWEPRFTKGEGRPTGGSIKITEWKKQKQNQNKSPKGKVKYNVALIKIETTEGQVQQNKIMNKNRVK